METLKSQEFPSCPIEDAPVNINCTNIHSGLGIGIDRASCTLYDKQSLLLRNILSEVKMVIIDVILIVSRVIFFRLKNRFIGIGCDSKKAFGGLPVII